MSMDFSNTEMNLAGINNYLKEKGVTLSEQDSKKLNTIFEECDIYNDAEKKDGKDGRLNFSEYLNFINKISSALPAIRDKVSEFFNSKNNEALKAMQMEKLEQKPDALRVYNPEIELLNREEQANKAAETAKANPPQILGKNSDVRTSYEWSEEEFNKVLDQMLNAPRYRGKFSKSVLKEKAKAFITSGKKYNIDPRLLVAIAMCESERGTSAKAQKLNNIGGLRINGKYHHFESVEASIDSIAKTIDTRYKEGYTTTSKIGNSGKYCAKWAASEWINNVSSYFNFFNKYYKPDEN